MQTFNSARIGVDQGNIDLFSDFADGGEMWTGAGARERRQTVKFSQAYSHNPVVHVTLSLWDMDAGANVRADITAENVTETEFEMVFRTWSDTRVARVRISWMSIGEVASEDDWDLY